MKMRLHELLNVPQERLQTAANSLRAIEFEQWKIDRLDEAITDQVNKGQVYESDDITTMKYRKDSVEFFRTNLKDMNYESDSGV